MTADELTCTHCTHPVEIEGMCYCHNPACWRCHDNEHIGRGAREPDDPNGVAA